MRKVLTSEEMHEVDRLTTEKYGIPPILLMENAAHAAARVISEKLGGSVDGKSFLVLCGKGNNGGDGAALARVLWQQGADVEVCLFGLVEDTKDHARVNFEILRKITDQEGFELDQTDLAFEEITSLEEWLEYDSLNFHCDDPDVLVDALFGTGLKRALDGVYEQVAAYISAYTAEDAGQGTFVVSLDVPSGLDSDCGERIGMNARAHVTVTFTAPKLANVIPPASNFSGELRVENIGSPCELINETASRVFVAEMEDACDWLTRTNFTPNSYKNKRGHALLIAGSKNYSGAAVLCANAAIRSGVGLVTIATPESSLLSVSSRVLPDVIVRSISQTENRTVSEDTFHEIEEYWGNVDAVAIGSGLSMAKRGERTGDSTTPEFVRRVVENRRTPLLIDADGLNALSPFDLQGSAEMPLILTPHEGEFLRLIGTTDKDDVKDRVKAARRFAEKHCIILVLKGERTLIVGPGGKVVINSTGNSGLGKAGNGDTLTGIITGFVAQAVKMNVPIFETIVAAVYIAGLAGDIAAAKYGKRIMTASDVQECLAEAFEEILR